MPLQPLKYAPDAWKLLNGIFCVYKPSGKTCADVKDRIIHILTKDLNAIEGRPPEPYVEITGSLMRKSLNVVERPSFSDHPLVVGPRYQKQDFEIKFCTELGLFTSGVLVCGIGSGCDFLPSIHDARHLREYEIEGKFGILTDDHTPDGLVIEKTTFDHITAGRIDRVLAAIQAVHQNQAFKYAGVDIQSQKAYEMAVKGLVRPEKLSPTLIYAIQCTKLNLPYFTLRFHCINEKERRLLDMVHEIGLSVKSSAICTKLRCIRYGHFTLEHALLRKHWTCEHIINNIQYNKQLVDPKNVFQPIELKRRNELIALSNSKQQDLKIIDDDEMHDSLNY